MPSSSSDSATLVDTVEDNPHPVDDTLKDFARKNSSASSLQSTGKKIKLVTGSHAKALHQYLLKCVTARFISLNHPFLIHLYIITVKE